MLGSEEEPEGEDLGGDREDYEGYLEGIGPATSDERRAQREGEQQQQQQKQGTTGGSSGRPQPLQACSLAVNHCGCSAIYSRTIK